eukprot:5528106-Pyramimonas_sp.AAC.1
MSAPRVPGCGEVVAPLGLQPLQARGRRLAWASRPADTAGFPGADGIRIAAIVLVLGVASAVLLVPRGPPYAPVTIAVLVA